MNPVAFIEAKRDGHAHSREELEAFLSAYLRGEIPDYQVSAWLMAVFWRGMTPEETTALTQVMADSGHRLDLSAYPHPVDKHSSGGVGDKTTLVVTPILAACGCTVAKMSGRGLAHTGGTIDKLESVPGWSGDLSEERFHELARTVGLVIAAQSKDLAPLDGKLYALRDVTATVDSLPLIASSIMSKKLAAGARTIVLDVKVGAGAFMKTLDDARRLAQTMIAIGKGAGRQVRAVLSSMERPLGHAVGHAVEVREAIATLRGEGAEDLRELALALAAEVLEAEGKDPARAREALESGGALAKFREFLQAQGGDAQVVEEPERLELAPEVWELKAPHDGAVAAVDALEVGLGVLALGGGRVKKGEAIDLGVGAWLAKKPGDRVREGEVLARLHHRGKGLEEAAERLGRAYRLAAEAPNPPLILDVLRG